MAKNSVTRAKGAIWSPGFNAEASLYRSSASYRSTGGAAGTTGALNPASAPLCFQRCARECAGRPYGCYQECILYECE